MSADLDQELERAARTLAASRYAIALVGAGISVESGIRPFRGKGGLWTEKGEPPMDGYQRFMLDPAAGWRDMLARRASADDFSKSLAAAVPNEGHLAMAELERMGALRHTITQNIDNLHFDAGSVSVTEIHGNRTKVRCIDCGARWTWAEFTQHKAFDEHALPPACPQCRGIVKSDTVMFGEPIPMQFLRECEEQAYAADCCLIVGTSATVYPAAHFPQVVGERGGALIEINTDPTPFTAGCAAVLRGPAGALLPLLVARLREQAAKEQRA
jgi:NAD-dependent deacetylase